MVHSKVKSSPFWGRKRPGRPGRSSFLGGSASNIFYLAMMLWIFKIDSLLWHLKCCTEQLLGGSAAGTSSKTSQVSGRALLLQACHTLSYTLGVAIGPGKTQPDRSFYDIWWGEASCGMSSNILWGTPLTKFLAKHLRERCLPSWKVIFPLFLSPLPSKKIAQMEAVNSSPIKIEH